MSRIVLLIEPDVDLLGTLASKLRSRGLEVAIADSIESAGERARISRAEVLLLSSSLQDETLDAKIKASGALALLPRFLIVNRDGDLGPNELSASDPEGMAKRVYALPPKAHPVGAEGGDFRGDLQQVSVTDLLQLLSMNRRNGTLSLTTPLGAGELRLANGEVVDAVYRRVDGEKALFRLLAELEGTFAFMSGTQQALRRIERPTHALLMEGLRQVDECKKLRDILKVDDQSLLAIGAPRPDAPEIEQRVLVTLVTPRSLSQLLDEIAGPDLEILMALDRLLDEGIVRSLAGGHSRAELADPERMSVLAALTKRVAKAGFEGAARVGIAGSQQRLTTMLAALGNIVDGTVVNDVPAAPVPHPLARLRLAEGVELEVVGVPLVEAYAPLWNLVFPSLIAIARTELTACEAFERCCSLTGVVVIDASSLLSEDGESDPSQIATLVRMALEGAAGG